MCINQIEALSDLAPLHNPANVAGIYAFCALLPEATHAAVFDTAFHSSMPAVAYRIPYQMHFMTSMRFVNTGPTGRAICTLLKKRQTILVNQLKTLNSLQPIRVNGVSLTAVDGGQSVDTRWALPHLPVFMMGTRTGELDASIIPYIMAKTGITDVAEVIDTFNKKSGLAGISDISSDMRDIISAREAGDEKATLAFDMFVNRIQKIYWPIFSCLKWRGCPYLYSRYR